jgi:hypothetical protein
MADLAVSYEFVVDVKIEAGVNALEVDIDILARKIILGQLKRASVKSRRIGIGNVGRINGVGVVYVSVVGSVVALAENGLPGARNGHLVESAGAEAFSGEILNHRGNGIEFEIPIAAKREEARTCRTVVGQSGCLAVVRNEISARLFATVVQNLLGLVKFVFKAHVVISLNDCFYLTLLSHILRRMSIRNIKIILIMLTIFIECAKINV